MSEYSLTVEATKDRLVEAGMRLFAQRGFDATSVADIQTECGLAPGSGALYKHFPSKKDLLCLGVRRYVEQLVSSRSRLLDILPDDPAEALPMIAIGVADAMAGDAAVIRVALRDLEKFPDLLSELWEGLLGALYEEFAGWLLHQRNAGRLQVDDPSATSAVLLASLTYHRVLEALIERTPGDVELGPYLAAWVQSALATLAIDRSNQS